MIEECTVDRATCDGCGRTQYAEDGQFSGWGGEAIEQGDGYGRTVRWFACRRSHIAKAIANQIAASEAQHQEGQAELL